MSKSIELPSTPTRVVVLRVLAYATPPVGLRWQRWRDGWRDTDRDLRWYGSCIACNRTLWAFDDGENDPRGPLGDNALWSITEDDQPPSRTCAICANDHDSYDRAQQYIQRLDVDDWRAIEWPAPIDLPEELTRDNEPEPDPEPTYQIVRRYFNSAYDREVIATGLTLEKAREHCQDPETSSSTATSSEATRRTEMYGPWFDGYVEE